MKNKKLHEVIDLYLSSLRFGEIIIIKHENKLTVDVKNRNRTWIGDLEETN